MAVEFVVRDVFRLGAGTIVLACEGRSDVHISPGSRAKLVRDDRVLQSFSILGERRMLKASMPPSHRALETRDPVELSAEEARSGAWRLVLDE